jgi:hypothetical protein
MFGDARGRGIEWRKLGKKLDGRSVQMYDFEMIRLYRQKEVDISRTLQREVWP